MRKVFLIASIALIITAVLKAQGNKKPPETVKKVDLKRYTGLWYEIARMPNRFQKDCTGETTAEYSLMEDGRISVKNSCTEENNERDVAEGVAKIVDKETNAKLKVSFFSILGIRPAWGDYWIIGLGNNYEYAIVGTPDRKYGWILSRTPKLPEDTLSVVKDILVKQGYNPSDFKFTPQNGKPIK